MEVIVERRAVPTELAGTTHRGVLWQAKRGSFLLAVPEVARYHVEGGERISIDAEPGASDEEIDRYLRTSPLAALYLQRGQPVLHAAWLTPPYGEAVVLAGDSSAGKSTLACELWRRGWSVGADDLTPITLDADGRACAEPTATQLVLWPGTVERFETLGRDSAVVGSSGDRQSVPASPRVVTTPRLVSAIWRLCHHNKDDIEATRMTGVARFHGISTMAYNSRIADALVDRTGYLRIATALVNESVTITLLTTPRGRWAVGEAADAIGRVATAQRAR